MDLLESSFVLQSLRNKIIECNWVESWRGRREHNRNWTSLLHNTKSMQSLAQIYQQTLLLTPHKTLETKLEQYALSSIYNNMIKVTLLLESPLELRPFLLPLETNTFNLWILVQVKESLIEPLVHMIERAEENLSWLWTNQLERILSILHSPQFIITEIVHHSSIHIQSKSLIILDKILHDDPKSILEMKKWRLIKNPSQYFQTTW